MLVAIVSFTACMPALYKPAPELVTGDVSYEQLVAGRKLYVSKCGSCHALYLPQQYERQVWEHNMEEMQERSNVSDPEKKLILLYLDNYPGNNISQK